MLSLLGAYGPSIVGTSSPNDCNLSRDASGFRSVAPNRILLCRSHNAGTSGTKKVFQTTGRQDLARVEGSVGLEDMS